MPSVLQRRRVAFLPGYYVYRIHRGIAKYAAEHRWILDSSMAISGQVPENWQGDGIISYLARREDVDKKIESCGVPTVDLSYRPNRFGAPRVFHDNVLIGRMAGEHLLSQGFRDIGYVGYWEGYNDTERMAGLKEIVIGAGRHFHELHWEKIEEELSALPRPLALMIQNDYLAVTLLQKLEDLGVRVPEEVAV
ncbi:substrate-binding domain-containing protein, partial [Verrucomicrobiaceae bacterium N1E253]